MHARRIRLLFPGDPVTVTGTATNLNPKKTATYTWTCYGVKVTGDNNIGQIDTSGLAPGTTQSTVMLPKATRPASSRIAPRT